MCLPVNLLNNFDYVISCKYFGFSHIICIANITCHSKVEFSYILDSKLIVANIA